MTRLAALLLALLAALPASVAHARDRLTIGIGQFPSDLHPTAGNSMAAKSYVLGLTQRPLTAFDASWQLVCLLCTELPTFENGKAVKEPQPDGTMGVALTYTLQPGARWGDGVPVTTKDVLFTLEVGRDPQSGLANAEMYRRIPRIDAVDDKTFVVHETKLTYDYNALGDFHILPEHLERPVFAKDPATYRNRTVFDTDPTNPGLAFGPYRIASVTPGSRIDLDRNPTWWGDPPAFDHITLKGIENTAALEANLLSGEIDMIEGSVGLSLEQALAFEKRNGDRFKVAYKPGLVFEHIDPNLDNPILADVRVRQALMYGSDRAAIDKRLFGGRQPPAATFVSPLDWVYAADLPPYPFDPKRAAALLEEAGWKPGPDGTRVDAQGHPLRLELATTAGNRTRELVQQVLQSQWRQLGIDVHAQGRAAARLLRRDGPAPDLPRPGALRLDLGPRERAADHPPLRRDPDRRERLGGPERQRLPQPQGRRPPRRDRGRARQGEAPRDVARAAGHLPPGPAEPAALPPLGSARLAEVAGGDRADRPAGAGDAVGGAVAGNGRRVTRDATIATGEGTATRS